MQDNGITSLIAILFGSGLMNAVMLFICVRLSFENRKLHFQLYQREQWHQKELQKWRERL